MGSFKLKNLATFNDRLEPGEAWLAGAVAMPPGGTKRLVGGAGLGGAVGVLIAGTGKGASASVELPRQFVIGLTNRRLVFFDNGLGGPKPKEVLFTIPLEQVARASLDASGVMSRRITFDLRDQEPLVVEIQKGMVAGWAKDLVEQLQPLLAGNTA